MIQTTGVRWFRLLSCLLILTLFLYADPVEGQVEGPIRIRLTGLRDEDFARPGGSCNEVEGEKRFRDLVRKQMAIDAMTGGRRSNVVKSKSQWFFKKLPVAELRSIGHLFCAYRANQMVSCIGGKCICTVSNREWNNLTKTCDLKFGQTCESSDDCGMNQICSNMEGPVALRRDDPYIWQFNGDCKRAAIRKLCLSENKMCAVDPTQCREVSRCFRDSYDTPSKAIAVCHPCHEKEDVTEREECQSECKTEFEAYITATNSRFCHEACRLSEDIRPDKCFDLCSDPNDEFAVKLRRETCPDDLDIRRCTSCLGRLSSGSTATSLAKKLEDECEKGSCGSGDVKKCEDACNSYCQQNWHYETLLSAHSKCQSISNTMTVCVPIAYNEELLFEEGMETCRATCNTIDPCDKCRKQCKTSKDTELQTGALSGRPELDMSIGGQRPCNAFCRIDRYGCKSCAESYKDVLKTCNKECEVPDNNVTACADKCMNSCIKYRQTAFEGNCYAKCLDVTDGGGTTSRLKCDADCLDPALWEVFVNEECEQLCSMTKIQAKTPCHTVCQDNCARHLTLSSDSASIPGIYCTDKRLCDDQTDCDVCRENELKKCTASCIPGDGVVNRPANIACDKNCFDTCETTRPAIQVAIGSAIFPCVMTCFRDTSKKVQPQCTSRCVTYCNTINFATCICNNMTKPVALNFTREILKNPCLTCTRNHISDNYKICRDDKCKLPPSADPGGFVCLRKCLDQGYEINSLDSIVRCDTFCGVNATCKSICTSALDLKALREAFGACYNPGFLTGEVINICKPDACLVRCADIQSATAGNRCQKTSETTCIESTAAPPSLPLDKTCLKCRLDVQTFAVNRSAEFCSLETVFHGEHKANPEVLLGRNRICQTACYETCQETYFTLQSKVCRTKCSSMLMSPPAFATCVLSCVRKDLPGLSLFCTNMCNAAPSPKDAVGICSECHVIYTKDLYYYEELGIIKCRDECREKQDPLSQCDLCTTLLINEKCDPGCSNPSTCPMFCDQYCEESMCQRRAASIADWLNPDERKECIDEFKMSSPKFRPSLRQELDDCQKNCKRDCGKGCAELCRELKSRQLVCEKECIIVNKAMGVSLTFRQQRIQRPTRKPGPGGFGAHWCCYDNGNGQCNASDPRISKAPDSLHVTEFIKFIVPCATLLLVLTATA